MRHGGHDDTKLSFLLVRAIAHGGYVTIKVGVAFNKLIAAARNRDAIMSGIFDRKPDKFVDAATDDK